MGAIMAMERDGVVYLGVDAAVPRNSGCQYMNDEDNIRLYAMPCGVAVASLGSLAVIQRLFLHSEWFETEEGQAFDKRFIVRHVLPRLIRELDRVNLLERSENEGAYLMGTNFIFAKGKDIYIVKGDMSVFRCDGLVAADYTDKGEGMLAFAANCKESDPETVIRKTFAWASAHYKTVFAHGFMLNTKDLTVKRMEDLQ